jgi:hypothetical protein
MSTPVVVTRIQNRRGTQDQFNGAVAIYPPTYDGIGGFGSGAFIPPFNVTNYPNVLLPGELALCTDTRNLYMGNINGEYVTLTTSTGTEIFLNPLTASLPPVGVFTTIPGATFTLLPTPFFNLVYSLTDDPAANWDTVGTNFSRNGVMNITAVVSAPTLTDTGTEINLTANSISFQAIYNLGNIEIQYMHNFAGALTFNTSTIRWIPF